MALSIGHSFGSSSGSTWTRSLQRLRADGITWTAAAVACGAGWAEARQLLREMKDLQVEVLLDSNIRQ